MEAARPPAKPRGFRILPAVVVAALAVPGQALAGSTFLVQGGGWGHGVGLSQYGAEGYALHGWDYRRILRHYYPHTTFATAPDRQVRVLLAEKRRKVAVGSSAPFLVRDAGGFRAHVRPRTLRFTPRLRFRGRALVTPVRILAGAQPLVVDGVGYRGDVVLRVREGGLEVVSEVRLERYLQGVVPAEMPWKWRLPAYEAQAVAARSYALSQLKPAQDFDLYSDERDQVYGGIPAERPETNLAVGQTAGRILTWDDRPIVGYYSASSGGRTAAVSDVWPDKPQVPYLVPVSDPFDTLSPYHSWTVAVSPARAARKLHVGVRDLRAVMGAAGRVVAVEATGPNGTRRMAGAKFRDALDLRSTRFSIRVLSLAEPARHAVYGSPLALTGFVRGLAGVVVQERSATGTWLPVARVHAGRNGRFRTVVRPRASTSFRLAVDGRAGSPVAVRVARRIHVRARGSVLAGKVQPAAPVRIERRIPGGWRPIVRVPVGPSGFFRTELRRSGRYRAVAEPGDRYLTSASPPVSVAR